MNLFLSGGGSAEQTAVFDSQFFASLPTRSRLLYIPVALRELRPLADCISWFEALCQRYGSFEIAVADDLSGAAANATFDALYIGGGNTYRLLSELRASGFDKRIARHAAEGLPIYGGSAGAVVLGSNIESVSGMDTNKVGVTDYRGLGLIEEYAIWPHYSSRSRPDAEAFTHSTGRPVIAIPEGSGVHVATGIELIGEAHMVGDRNAPA